MIFLYTGLYLMTRTAVSITATRRMNQHRGQSYNVVYGMCACVHACVSEGP